MTEKFQMVFPVPSTPRVLRNPDIPFKALAVQCEDGKIRFIKYLPHKHSEEDNRPSNNTLVDKIETQLHKYFETPESECLSELRDDLRKTDDVPDEVQKAVCRIPCGRVCTYGDTACVAIGEFHWDGDSGREDEKEKSPPEKIGCICKRNPHSIVVPCFRVINKIGRKLGGFSGNERMMGIDQVLIKAWLLDHEREGCVIRKGADPSKWEVRED